MMLKRQVRRRLNALFERRGYRLAEVSFVEEAGAAIRKRDEYVAELVSALGELGGIELPERAGRLELLGRLIGTTISEGVHICAHLNRALRVEGDVCEFGVAQGATSALLANEIADIGRRLWLYDSFEGLPAPTARDVLINDIFRLGAMEKYEGTMRCPEMMVMKRLEAIRFPVKQYEIVKGFFENSPTTPGPARVCFAYVDFDFYKPILDALEFIEARMPVGGCVIVDDYGWFTAGGEAAVSDFLGTRSDSWRLELPPRFCRKFCALVRTR